MPELPEVETVKEELQTIVGGKILDIQYSGKKLREPVKDINNLKGQKIEGVYRRAKYLILKFTNHYYAISHLGMTGSFYWIKEGDFENKKHYHLNFKIEKNGEKFILSYQDPRRFGLFITGTGRPQENEKIKTLGPEPEDLTDGYLKSILNSQKIKPFLLDQQHIAGIGNIYADEILFKSCILPFRSSQSLTDQEVSQVVKNTKKIIAQAIINKGSTILSYTGLNGVKGNNQNFLRVYGRAKQPCLVCNTPIANMKIGGRNTCYCPNCQK